MVNLICLHLQEHRTSHFKCNMEMRFVTVSRLAMQDWSTKKGFFSEQPPIGSRLEFNLPTYCVSELALANVLRKDPTYASYVSADN
jgi:hypothetical protein